MDIHSAAHYMKCGYRITRQKWARNFYSMSWVDKYRVTGFYFHLEDFLADDWEIDRRYLVDDSGDEPVYNDPLPRDEEEE